MVSGHRSPWLPAGGDRAGLLPPVLGPGARARRDHALRDLRRHRDLPRRLRRVPRAAAPPDDAGARGRRGRAHGRPARLLPHRPVLQRGLHGGAVPPPRAGGVLRGTPRALGMGRRPRSPRLGHPQHRVADRAGAPRALPLRASWRPRAGRPGRLGAAAPLHTATRRPVDCRRARRPVRLPGLHADPLRRLARALPRRPGLLSPELRRAVQRTLAGRGEGLGRRARHPRRRRPVRAGRAQDRAVPRRVRGAGRLRRGDPPAAGGLRRLRADLDRARAVVPLPTGPARLVAALPRGGLPAVHVAGPAPERPPRLHRRGGRRSP